MQASTPPTRARLAACLVRTIMACACCVAAQPVLAADKTSISTDRPDFVDSSDVVGKNHFQLETSIGADHNREGALKASTLSMPTLLRFGLSDTMELRLESDGRARSRVSGMPGLDTTATTYGYADVSVGAKWHLLDEAGAMPAVGALVHAQLPTGSPDFGGDGVRPIVRLVAEWSFPGGMSLGVMPGLASDKTDEGKRYTAGLLGVVVGKAWNDRLRSFVELSAPKIARGKHGGSELNFNTGLAWLLNDTCQLDTALSRGLNSRTTDFGLTIGFSIKL